MDKPVGVDSFWKRVPAEALDGCGPKELHGMVPYWREDGFEAQCAAGILVAAEDTGALIDTLLDLGTEGADPELAVLIITRLPQNWDDDWMVGSIPADDVRKAATLLVDAPFRRWADQHHAALVAAAKRQGYNRPFDETWSAQVVSDAEELASLFTAAAANNEAVIVTLAA